MVVRCGFDDHAKADAKAIALEILGLAVILVVVGLLMEHLRDADVLPWSAP